MAEQLNYEVACLQTRSRQVSRDDDAQRDSDIRANLERIFELIDYITAFGNSEVRLDRAAGICHQRALAPHGTGRLDAHLHHHSRAPTPT